MPEVGEQLLARIEEVTGCPALLIRPLSGSILNVVHLVRCGERELVAKMGAAEGIRREAAVLTMLRPTGVPVPHAALLPADPSFPSDLLLVDVLPGHAAEPDSEVLADAGRSLRRLHDIRLPGFGPVADGPAGTSATWAGFLDGVVAEARRAVPEHVLPAALHDEVDAQSRHRRVRAHVAGVDHGVLLHGDLVPKHVWDDHGRLAGLIDWGDAMVGDPLFDLARFSMSGEDAFRRCLDGYRTASPQDPYVLAFYRMVWSLMALIVECGAGGDWVDGYLSTVRDELHRLRTADEGGQP
ncbi:phosphotransferase family protein [Micromonospora sp. NPDC000089]|uniref:phosphotransferase family protein n=1 Tax=unclassified Micromonospora TaxID=2617518 RepID=UPI003681A0DF